MSHIDCPRCNTTMDDEGNNHYSCYGCHLEITIDPKTDTIIETSPGDESFLYETVYGDTQPSCCDACGNPAYPDCMDSCKIFDT